MILLQELNPLAGGVGTIAAVAFFLIFIAVAFIAFKMLRRTVKLAVRAVIVAVILAIAIAGSIALWAVGTAGPTRPQRPTSTR